MKLNELIEIATIISAHSPNLIEGGRPLADDALHQYRNWSNTRSGSWLAAVEVLPRRLVAATVVDRFAIWNMAERMLVDIMAGSLLARVWGAILTANGRSRHDFSTERIARRNGGSGLVHQRVLKLISGTPSDSERVVRLDRILRRSSAGRICWQVIVARYGLADFVFDAISARFREEHSELAEPERALWNCTSFVCGRRFLISNFCGCRRAGRQELIGAMLRTLPASIFLEDAR